MSTLNTIDYGIAASTEVQSALQTFRSEKLTQLANWPIPTRKTEAWKYSAKRLGLNVSANSEETNKTSEKTGYQSPFPCSLETIVVSNQSEELNLPEVQGIKFTRFSELDQTQTQLITNGVIAKSEHLMFADLNTAYLQNGLLIEVADKEIISKPLKIVFKLYGTKNHFPRVFVKLGKSASLTLIEEIQTETNLSQDALAASNNLGLLNSVVDIHVSANAHMTYLRYNADRSAARLIGSTGVALMKDARFKSFCLSLGNQLNRHDLLIKMLESGAECDLNGVCVTTDKQHADCHTCIEHIAPHCTSNENYRCIADKQSQIVFNGRIHIHPNAQKTLGSMSNKNLLLSSEAEIDSKPELEIYADDVKCAHGTTIGQLDETELYYLQTRGITYEQAKLMLTLGFVLEIVRAVPVEEIADYWEQTLASILSYTL